METPKAKGANQGAAGTSGRLLGGGASALRCCSLAVMERPPRAEGSAATAGQPCPGAHLRPPAAARPWLPRRPRCASPRTSTSLHPPPSPGQSSARPSWRTCYRWHSAPAASGPALAARGSRCSSTCTSTSRRSSTCRGRSRLNPPGSPLVPPLPSCRSAQALLQGQTGHGGCCERFWWWGWLSAGNGAAGDGASRESAPRVAKFRLKVLFMVLFLPGLRNT